MLADWLRERKGDVVVYKAEEESPVRLRLYVYEGGQEKASVPLGEQGEWDAFAAWASQQGGELARLAYEGHSDAFREKDSLADLRKQLADVPEKYAAVAGKLRAALANHDAEGLMVSAEED